MRKIARGKEVIKTPANDFYRKGIKCVKRNLNSS